MSSLATSTAPCCRWHDDFTAFKAGVHDLEVMLENVMQLALDSTPSLPGILELLEGFQGMAKRTAVKRAVERHMSEFYRRFMAEINAVKKHFDTLRRTPTTSPMLPHYAGAARWAGALAQYNTMAAKPAAHNGLRLAGTRNH